MFLTVNHFHMFIPGSVTQQIFPQLRLGNFVDSILSVGKHILHCIVMFEPFSGNYKFLFIYLLFISSTGTHF